MSNDVVITEGTERGLEAYMALVEELNALKTEQNFDLSMRQIQWAHLWGKTIRDHAPRAEKKSDRFDSVNDLDGLLTRVSVDVGKSKRTLYRCVQLFDTYPDLQVAFNAHGKNVSIRLLLGGDVEKVEEEKAECSFGCERHCKKG